MTAHDNAFVHPLRPHQRGAKMRKRSSMQQSTTQLGSIADGSVTSKVGGSVASRVGGSLITTTKTPSEISKPRQSRFSGMDSVTTRRLSNFRSDLNKRMSRPKHTKVTLQMQEQQKEYKLQQQKLLSRDFPAVSDKEQTIEAVTGAALAEVDGIVAPSPLASAEMELLAKEAKLAAVRMQTQPIFETAAFKVLNFLSATE